MAKTTKAKKTTTKVVKTPKPVKPPKAENTTAKQARNTTNKAPAKRGKKFGNAQPVCVGSGDRLMLLESPSKIAAVAKYLGAGWRVMATFGHCVDLPENKMAIDTQTWVGEYEITPSKAAVVKAIREQVKTATEVYLGTDPDREGEAIAWLVYEKVKSANSKAKWYRTSFNAITKDAIEKSIKQKAAINMDLVLSQRARRFMDKLVGYGISPLLRQSIRAQGTGLSAGRVQSVALRILSERQREIEAFKPDEYWEIFANTVIANVPVKMQLSGYKGKPIKIHNQQEADKVTAALATATGHISHVKETDVTRQPKAPFTTATLQQAAATQLGYTVKTTMDIAQELFAKAFISYHRSDSTRLEPEQIQAAQDVLKAEFGNNYAATSAVHYKSKSRSKVQDAHTAIQPTNPAQAQIMGTPPMQKLYALIRNRFLACQSVPAKFKSKVLTAKIGDYDFKATGSTLVFDGYLKVFGYAEEENEEEQDTAKLPVVVVNDPVSITNVEPKQKFTQPPAYYNDASLVKTLESNGVGRPSTYAATIDKLEERRYTERDGKKIIVTPIGYAVCDYLIKNFDDIFNVGFTATMETKLDLIEDATVKWDKVLTDFWASLSPRIKAMKTKTAEDTGRTCPVCHGKVLKYSGWWGPYFQCENPDCNAIDKRSGEKMEAIGECPNCGKPVVKKMGQYGEFLSCSGYPACKTICVFDDNGNLIEKVKGQSNNTSSSASNGAALGACPNCGADVVEKNGKFGTFMSCSAYPRCKTICVWDNGALVEKAPGQKVATTKAKNTGNAGKAVGKCPNCGADVVEKQGKFGTFMSCSAYPNCRTICVRDTSGNLIEKGKNPTPPQNDDEPF